ncbi:hypothetical protein [Streptomyces acidiscabies]|uniref:DUF4352 domain-containing protein n=1 Tax=Streptomyces acidiscabies TaxID=42234 RepID=A0AAP6BBG1_9ACTN|nr:hypothetical protein [Streptomyces acidiscabies]MBP5938015.1 DUF4352 domain-containing protein [Streptomyces sp. LBUM 1476]MBZ3909017.1 hypothetical protein [Streptomyces acidiscabies]MDX2961553.1 hypothetical protein [Streptomyces acidiscabies]MDX3016579.1 hypothetical protein [Streptomyces acidiscabies]MDX3788516.1 hypothetical protein [Streptomyces acidiscabies]
MANRGTPEPSHPITPLRRLPALLALPLVLLAPALLTSCDTGSTPGTAPNATPSPQLPSRPHQDGHLVFTVLSLRCGILGVTGTHSDAMPDGQFCAARLRVDNPSGDFHPYAVKDQRLEGATGRAARPDSFAMAVRRQHESISIGGHSLVEVELWYDVPRDAKITGLRVTGDRDPASWMATTPAAHAPDGLLIPMKPVLDS